MGHGRANTGYPPSTATPITDSPRPLETWAIDSSSTPALCSVRMPLAFWVCAGRVVVGEVGSAKVPGSSSGYLSAIRALDLALGLAGLALVLSFARSTSTGSGRVCTLPCSTTVTAKVISAPQVGHLATTSAGVSHCA